METNLNHLFEDIKRARNNFVDLIKGLTTEQINFKPSSDEWSILEITEHLVWAEQIGVCGMFMAIDGIKDNKPIWAGKSTNDGLTIEQIVERTWQPKEIAPEVAEPRWGGSIFYWRSSLENCQNILTFLQSYMVGINPEIAIYPHPISGPINVNQRLQFLRFHLERHQKQLERVKNHSDYPNRDKAI